jgi:hypothetical protein
MRKNKGNGLLTLNLIKKEDTATTRVFLLKQGDIFKLTGPEVWCKVRHIFNGRLYYVRVRADTGWTHSKIESLGRFSQQIVHVKIIKDEKVVINVMERSR